MIKVYHSKWVWSGFEGIHEPLFPRDYVFVAEVQANHLDEAFVLTNTIEEFWTQNAKVRAVRAELRSTSVGDVLERDGKYYRCELFGWKKIK